MSPARGPVAIYTATSAIGGVEMVGVRAHEALEAAGVPCRLHVGIPGALRSRRPRRQWMALTWKTHALALARHPRPAAGGLLWVHGAELTRDTDPVQRALRRRTLERADGLLAVSPFVFELLPEMRHRITLVGPPIPPVVSLAEPRGPVTPGSHPVRLLSVGRAEPRKGHDTAIAVARHLSAHVAVRLDIVGPGPDLPRLADLAVTSSPHLDVRIHGRVSEVEKDRLYHEADVLLFLTRQEGAEVDGLGLVVLEAAARGCPAVVLSSGGTRFTVADGASGAVVPADASVATIADMAWRVMTDAAARDAARRYADRFGLQAWSERLVAVVEGRPVPWAWPTLPPRPARATFPTTR